MTADLVSDDKFSGTNAIREAINSPTYHDECLNKTATQYSKVKSRFREHKPLNDDQLMKRQLIKVMRANQDAKRKGITPQQV